ncbi:MAG: type II toxin-antitoxin system ParD family antitoxin [Candidatus Dadabacteria bacterium]|nr:type II toxin-antitoxin system ParD family antitoxin [Candidatus Dadabacteria bacterium]MDE0519986.1 type II toxin-antitoxin system ParD family antitoxin [Candidatus Dadabacteria bacterium]MDE0663160.1 type II toxin-antitoxin system ParD family antitoxin [Candidatus Dadabacteria bacterium]MYB27344.1 type II toxin-antitoxin system ParD family antitoxin [Candidatus Dadabacteria bacterium]
MNVSLTPKLEQFIREKVSSGLYNNASEVVREALRLLVKRDNTSIDRSLTAPLTKAEIHKQISSLEKPLRDRGIKSVSLFGSAVRDENTSASDIDVFIDTDPEASFSLLDLVDVKYFLEDNLGCEVDVVTREGLRPNVKQSVLDESEQVF